ncbi:helix-turn-helix domain-containing protein [Coxiella endosymbiont of Ornithodoros maritimus]|uniref:helix-turn-helix domain-containing protein n=1 Tax=Coxiella endosymbiont of Ornithodoros maritimus TaxID=1656172 RepID=UPI002265488E|nr:helix-turn-helix domain-containing protein [Coxiella endosymbiont of Ornithodoros maritimus]
MGINLARSDSTAKTPGILLRKARQAKNLQQSDVAKEIRLSIQWVKGLEQDDYSHVPALIYGRGYLRAYARYVGISPDEVMAAFNEMGLEEEFERVKAEVERPVKHHAVPVVLRSKQMINGKMLRWITVILLVVLIVSVGVWWQGKKHILGQLQSVISSPQENLSLKQTLVNSADTNETINTNLTEQATAIKYKNKITFSGTNH